MTGDYPLLSIQHNAFGVSACMIPFSALCANIDSTSKCYYSFIGSFLLLLCSSDLSLYAIYTICRQERGDRGDRDVWAAERKPRENRYDSASDSQGREGGRSLRSIASEKPSSSSSSSSSGRGSSSSDTDDWGASSSAKSTAPITSGGGAFTDSFNIAAWGDSLSSVTGQRAQTDKKSFKEDNYSSREKVPEPAVAAAGGGPEDFDRWALQVSSFLIKNCIIISAISENYLLSQLHPRFVTRYGRTWDTCCFRGQQGGC